MSKHRRRHHRDNTVQQESGFNINNIAQILKNINVDELSSMIENPSSDSKEEIEEKEEKNIGQTEILNSFKTLINADRAELIRTLIELYAASKNNLKK